MRKFQITKKIIKKLRLPRKSSHKGQNGRLLIVAGSEKYHGALLYAVKIASRIVDLVYVLTTRENRKWVGKLKSKTAEFVTIDEPLFVRRGRGGHREHYDYDPLSISPSRGGERTVDCILIGPGMGKSKRTYNFVRAVLKSGIKAVLDADALNVMDTRLLTCLNGNHVLTPHLREFKRLVSTSPGFHPSSRSQGRGWGKGREVGRFAKKYGCTVVLKGSVDMIASPSPSPLPSREREIFLKNNYTGNEGMTKGGTGDVLAGLIAAFYCKNIAFTSAAAAVYVNGAAGDDLYRKVKTFYNAEDLLEQIPYTLARLVNS